ncbi:MAG: Cof-type HAD-IIB family hydrolase [Firmicutes bacterium]|nr:Cof-type HAD-IIB family hydrolase [Bacillota bacterium]
MFYKLITCDLDDTLICDKALISDKTVETVRKYREAGGIFVISTGRITSSALPFARRLGLTGELVSYQGAVISDIESGKILKETPADYRLMAEILEYCDSKGLFQQIYKDDCVLIQKTNAFAEQYRVHANCPLIELHEPVYKYILRTKFNPLKAVIIDEPKRIPAILSDLQLKFGDKLRINTSKKWIVEITSPDISKASALEFLLEKHGIPREQSLAIGDSENDIPMLEYAGLSAVVKNGSPPALKIAKIIAPSNNDGGVAWVVAKALENSLPY